ncbi:MAG: hypothetical protein Harvfovirus17_17 [Harvfovirus sp.]|uniref:Uncharacterized protein n=1 Tax=Harvfovirus sp. TaxID=2487768 RepID=A0A3G5A5N0_9VIRU|nr:MAG: hypothetical protein Harvfovirus17_17 [Harvfovirus sp.]
MSLLILEGFYIYHYYSRYVTPVYSFTCECNIKVILRKYLNLENLEIFRPKYYQKYVSLLADETITFTQLKEKIPHIQIEPDRNSKKCQIHQPNITNEKTYKPGIFYIDNIFLRSVFSGIEMNEFYETLRLADNFEIGVWLEYFAIRYWVDSQYAWFTDFRNFSPTKEDKKMYRSQAFETKLLPLIQLDRNNFRDAINESLNSTNVIAPLVNLICDYGEPPTVSLGKIIHQFQTDIIKYS